MESPLLQHHPSKVTLAPAVTLAWTNALASSSLERNTKMPQQPITKASRSCSTGNDKSSVCDDEQQQASLFKLLPSMFPWQEAHLSIANETSPLIHHHFLSLIQIFFNFFATQTFRRIAIGKSKNALYTKQICNFLVDFIFKTYKLNTVRHHRVTRQQTPVIALLKSVRVLPVLKFRKWESVSLTIVWLIFFAFSDNRVISDHNSGNPCTKRYFTIRKLNQ